MVRPPYAPPAHGCSRSTDGWHRLDAIGAAREHSQADLLGHDSYSWSQGSSTGRRSVGVLRGEIRFMTARELSCSGKQRRTASISNVQAKRCEVGNEVGERDTEARKYLPLNRTTMGVGLDYPSSFELPQLMSPAPEFRGRAASRRSPHSPVEAYPPVQHPCTRPEPRHGCRQKRGHSRQLRAYP